MNSQIKSYQEISVEKSEIYKYLFIDKETKEMDEIINECLLECREQLSFKVTFDEYNVSINDNEIDFGFAKTKSNSLVKYINKREKVVIFVATIGHKMDRLIAKYSKLAPSKALVMQAIGTAYIEALCDCFNMEVSNNTRRFSPGYGDLSLEFQKDIFKVLSTDKIGVSLNNSLLMSPSKTVSAIISL